MDAVLGHNRYGKSGIRLVRVTRGDRHEPVDLTPYGPPNGGEVVVATDRPYGLLEGTVTRGGAPPADAAWA
jgi:urate oxidase